MSTITGIRGAHEQPPRYGFNESGPYSIRTWHGTLREVLQNIPAIQAGGGYWEIQETFTKTKVVLEARFANHSDPGQPEVPLDEWEFLAQEVEKDLLESDLQVINDISDDEKRKIRDAIANPDPDSSPALTDPNAIDVYQLMLTGVRSIRVFQPVIRHTQTVSNSWTIPASLTNVGSIISTANFASTENVPPDVLFSIPSNTSTRTGMEYGWYKKFPTIRGSYRGKVQIDQQWEYGLWSTLIYGNPI